MLIRLVERDIRCIRHAVAQPLSDKLPVLYIYRTCNHLIKQIFVIKICDKVSLLIRISIQKQYLIDIDFPKRC